MADGLNWFETPSYSAGDVLHWFNSHYDSVTANGFPNNFLNELFYITPYLSPLKVILQGCFKYKVYRNQSKLFLDLKTMIVSMVC